jgi:Big-like domain-containing protein
MVGSNRRLGRTARVLLLAGILLLGCGAAAADAATFGSPQDIAGTQFGNFPVACWSADGCVAAGPNADQSAGVVVAINDGIAGSPQSVTGLGNTAFSAVACDSAGDDCYAVAGGFPSDLVPIAAGVASADQPIADFDESGFACPPGSDQCAAVGSGDPPTYDPEFLPIDHGVAQTPIPLPAAMSPLYVACWAVGDCLVEGIDGTSGDAEVVSVTGGTVSTAQSLGLAASQNIIALACYGPANCFAVGNDVSDGIVVPIDGGVPQTPVPVPSMGSLFGVTCPPGPGDCLAVGQDSNDQAAALVDLHRDGTIGSPQDDPNPDVSPFEAIACMSATSCVATGSDSEPPDFATVGSITAIQLAPPTATITTPASGTTYAVGDKTPKFDFSCSAVDPATISSCDGTVSNGTTAATVASGDSVDTSAPGNFTLTVTATDSTGATDTATSQYTVAEADQTITFPPIGSFPYANPPVTLKATASSNLPVTYHVVSGNCTVDNSTSMLTFTGAGDCVVAADQAGNAEFNAAPEVTSTATVAAPTPATCSDGAAEVPNGTPTTIDLGCVVPPGSTRADFTATGSIVTEPVHGTLDGLTAFTGDLSGNNDISGTVTYTPAAGYSGSDSFQFKVTNSQGDSNAATITLTVDPPVGSVGPPTITITTPVSGGVYPVNGPAAFAFSCQAGTGGTLDGGQTGCDAQADGQEVIPGQQIAGGAGNLNHPGTQTLTVTATDTDGQTDTAMVTYTVGTEQTIAFPQLGPYPFGQAPVALKATASSGLPVSYTVVSGPCTVDNATSMLSFSGSGSCVVAADQAGNGTYVGAPTVDSTIVVSPPGPPSCSAQTLSFPFGATESIALVCTDAAGDTGDQLSYQIVTAPAHGTLSAVAGDGTVTYTPAAGFSGSDGFTFDGSNQQGTSSPAVVSITIAPETPPANTSLPGVSGLAALGQTLSCSNGVWSGGIPQTYSYQWLRDGGAIPGATGPAYAVADADQGHTLTCVVTAANSGGSASATSAGVAIPPAPVITPPPVVTPPAPTPPSNAGRPSVSGTARLGFSLSCAVGAWSGTAPLTYAYQWQRDGAAVSGATGPSFVVATTDIGHALACLVTASNAAGAASAVSPAVGVPLPSNVFSFGVKPRASKTGAVTFALQVPGSGRVTAAATFSEATTGKGAGIAKTKTVAYGKASVSAKHAGSVAVTIRPSKSAAKDLKKLGRLKLTIATTFTPTGGKASTRKSSLTVKHA